MDKKKKKARTIHTLPARDSFQIARHTGSEGMEEDILYKWRQTSVAILTARKTAFKTKAVARDKEGHFIMIKASLQPEALSLVSIYVPQHRSTLMHTANINRNKGRDQQYCKNIRGA